MDGWMDGWAWAGWIGWQASAWAQLVVVAGLVLRMRGCWVLGAGKEERVEAWKRLRVSE